MCILILISPNVVITMLLCPQLNERATVRVRKIAHSNSYRISQSDIIAVKQVPGPHVCLQCDVWAGELRSIWLRWNEENQPKVVLCRDDDHGWQVPTWNKVASPVRTQLSLWPEMSLYFLGWFSPWISDNLGTIVNRVLLDSLPLFQQYPTWPCTIISRQPETRGETSEKALLQPHPSVHHLQPQVSSQVHYCSQNWFRDQEFRDI